MVENGLEISIRITPFANWNSLSDKYQALQSDVFDKSTGDQESFLLAVLLFCYTMSELERFSVSTGKLQVYHENKSRKLSANLPVCFLNRNS